MPATPRRARNFGGSSQHQKLMMANMAASLFAAEAIVTTEAKAKAASRAKGKSLRDLRLEGRPRYRRGMPLPEAP